MEASSSAINAPHPDDVPGDDAAAFFGDEDAGTEEAEAAAVAEAAAEEDAAAVEDDAPTAAERVDAAGQTPPADEEAPVEDPPAADPTPPAGSAGQTDEASQQGSAEREYIVFQKLPLTEKVLKALLKEVESGNAPKPRVVFVELHRATTRNDRQAVAEAYKKNKDALGGECDLAAVSSRSFKERHVAPRVVTPATDIAIT